VSVGGVLVQREIVASDRVAVVLVAVVLVAVVLVRVGIVRVVGAAAVLLQVVWVATVLVRVVLCCVCRSGIVLRLGWEWSGRFLQLQEWLRRENHMVLLISIYDCLRGFSTRAIQYEGAPHNHLGVL
jgi:hypothetical protein